MRWRFPRQLLYRPDQLATGITTNLPGRVGLPFINVSGGFAIGNNFEGELPQTGNTFQWTDNFTKIVGKHTTNSVWMFAASDSINFSTSK